MKPFRSFFAAVLMAFALSAFAKFLYRLGERAYIVLFNWMGEYGLIKCVGNAPFPIIPEYTAIAMAYQNNAVIADAVLPRTPVGKKEFVYYLATQADAYTIPDTKVARRSSPNQVEFSATSVASFTQDYGLDDTIPQDDIDNAPPNFDPVARGVATLTNLILLDREVRVANLVFNTASYAAGLTSTLSGTSQWSDYTNSDPISVIMNALDTPLIRPNVAVFGRQTFSKLRMHPKVVQAVLGVANTGAGQAAGAVSRQAIADLFELDEVLVGAAFFNSAKKGQTATYGRVWGKHAAFIYRDTNALVGQKTVTFGFTPQFGTRIAGSWPVKENAGIKGGNKYRVGESVNELITCPDVGYFFQNAVA
jgi:hypothetical protein